MQNKYICYGTLLLLCQFNYLVLVKTNKHKISEHAEKRHIFRRHDNDIQTCLDSFDIHQDKIIRTQDSRDMGAKYINERDVPTRGDCLRLCCETENCDVFVFEEKSPGSCYLFECGTPEDFKCKFTKHRNYTSAVLAVSRHLSELETQIKFTQHEHELTKLREPEARQNNSLTSMKSTMSPKSKEFLQYGVDNAPVRPQRKGCSRNQFECHSDGECIAIYNACDGIVQCQDGSDEAPEMQCPGNQVSTGAPKLNAETVLPATSNEGLQEVYNNHAVNNNRDASFNTPPITVEQKQWVQNQKYGESDVGPQMINNGYIQKSQIIPNQGGNNLANNRANYGREGEGISSNFHPELQQQQQPPQQWNNYQYHQNSGSSQIFAHKGSGLIPQSDRFVQSHPHISQDVPIRNPGQQQFNDQGAYYYENVPFRMYPQNQPMNKWQNNGQQVHEQSGTMVDEGTMNHLDQPSVNNAPFSDYYYEENYRNRGPPYTNHIRPSYQAKDPNKEIQANNNNNQNVDNQVSNTEKQIPSTTMSTKAPNTNSEEDNSHKHHSHRKVDKLSAESKIKETIIDSEIDGHSASPSGAILSLTLGLCLTAFMVVIVGCRMKMVHRRMRRGCKASYAHDADFLVNGMYL